MKQALRERAEQLGKRKGELICEAIASELNKVSVILILKP